MVTWQIVEMFAVPPGKRGSWYVKKPDTLRAWELPCQLGVPMLPVFSYHPGVILEGDLAVQGAVSIAKTEFVICSFECLINYAQFDVTHAYMSPRMFTM